MKQHTQIGWTITGVEGNGYFIHDANGNHIATAETLDPANLIAAAPKLLAALKTAEWMLSRDYIDPQKLEVIKKCQAAIAAAKGE